MDKDTQGINASPNDDDYLARLGYKQEFKREFSRLELFGLTFSIVGVVPSIVCVLAFATFRSTHLPHWILQYSFTILHSIWRAGRDDMGSAY
jgi:uncharacterized membrane protein YesL